jgi:hypothetical protein
VAATLILGAIALIVARRREARPAPGTIGEATAGEATARTRS